LPTVPWVLMDAAMSVSSTSHRVTDGAAVASVPLKLVPPPPFTADIVAEVGMKVSVLFPWVRSISPAAEPVQSLRYMTSVVPSER